ncbi:MarR family winged helix-turn-helix transcriptional regulator [Tindallia californiensis]|uniref:DNA-binding transcriptional regulator, MarR family n=1 Tax=Tindallia californiensis TaxID=159292 RepID=A0A1H3L742_9FIRM|nr:MarR family transcriptional regulator [Tindallia californiensis]SDY60201.1 DNA-binding transcriptional regulator, MarR family [Tindallia californiensis]
MRNYYVQIYEYIEKLLHALIIEDKKRNFSGKKSLQILDLMLMSYMGKGKGSSIQKLITETGLKRNDITSAVKRLTERKMIYKADSDEDKRIKELVLTEQGEALLLEYRKQEQRELFELLDEFTFNEEKAILKFLVKVDMKYREKQKGQ